ncbi:MAG: AraC family transcriptional regulator [Terrimicrobiaceae bacterium]
MSGARGSSNASCYHSAFFGIQNSVKEYFEYFPSGAQEAAWTFHVAAAGRSRIITAQRYPSTKHPGDRVFTWQRGRVISAFQLVAISAGAGCFETREGIYRLRAGSVFFIPPGVWHRYRPDAASGWTEEWFELRGPALATWAGSGMFDLPPVVVGKRSGFWCRFQQFHSLCLRRPPGFRAIAGGLALALFAEAMQLSVLGCGPLAPLTELVRRASRYLVNGTNVGEVARLVGVSSITLNRHFKRLTGLTPKAYACQMRMARAENLVTGSDLSIKEIAARLGYHSASHFSLEFKRVHGLAPHAVRGR